MSVDMGATEDAASRRSGAPLGTSRLVRHSLLAGAVDDRVGQRLELVPADGAVRLSRARLA